MDADMAKSLGPSSSSSMDTTAPNKPMASTDEPARATTAAGSSQQAWQVTVKERKLKEKGKKVREPSYTLYVHTPDDTQLVLARTLSQIVSLDARLRSKLSARLPASRPPILAAMLHSPPAEAPTTPRPSRRKPRQVLQTLGRTLSPSKSRRFPRPFSSSSVSSDADAEPCTPPGSTSSAATMIPASRRPPPLLDDSFLPPRESDDGFVPIDLSTTERSLLSSLVADSERSNELQLADYISSLASDQTVRESSAWKTFTRIGREDFRTPKAPRLQQRDHLGGEQTGLKRVRSDLARHLGPALPTTASTTAAAAAAAAAMGEDQTRRISDARREAEEALGLTAQDVLALETLANGPASSAPGTPETLAVPSALPRAEAKVVDEPTEVEDETFEEARPAVDARDEDETSHIEAYLAMDVDPTIPELDEPEVEVPEVPVEDQEEDAETPSPVQVVEPSTEASSEDLSTSSPAPSRSPARSKPPRKTALSDFEILRVLGKGCAGKVLMVRHRRSRGVYAMKSIQKGHVLAHRELQHTLTEQSVLKRVADDRSNPFIVRLWWSFHDMDYLFLVMDFHNGGDLATQLARWGRLGRDRARFYAAEIAEGVIGLHRAGVVYRDLKPENVLIAGDGHVVLTDFGLSKQFDRDEEGGKRNDSGRETTTTFCGTAEYLAPEVLLGEPYSYEVDWWSFGTMLFEMLTGLTPFWSEDHATMYRRVLHDELSFSDESRMVDHDTKTLLRGLLQRDPAVRMTGPRIKRHPYFGMIDWDHVYHKRYIPPYVPSTDPDDLTDTSNFDDAFTSQSPLIRDEGEGEGEGEEGGRGTNGADVEPEHRYDSHGRDVFDGYSYLAPREDRDSTYDGSTEGEHAEGGCEGEAGEEVGAEGEASARGEEKEVEGSDLNDSYQRTPQASSSQTTASTRPTSVDQEPVLSDHGRSGSEGSPQDGSGRVGDGLEGPGEEEEGWDVVDSPGEGLWDRNGRRGNTLFARGVVDRYKLRMRPVGSGRHIPGFSRTGSSLSSLHAADPDGSFGSPPPTLPTSADTSRASSSDGRRFRLRQIRPDHAWRRSPDPVPTSSNAAKRSGRDPVGGSSPSRNARKRSSDPSSPLSMLGTPSSTMRRKANPLKTKRLAGPLTLFRTASPGNAKQERSE